MAYHQKRDLLALHRKIQKRQPPPPRKLTLSQRLIQALQSTWLYERKTS